MCEVKQFYLTRDSICNAARLFRTCVDPVALTTPVYEVMAGSFTKARSAICQYDCSGRNGAYQGTRKGIRRGDPDFLIQLRESGPSAIPVPRGSNRVEWALDTKCELDRELLFLPSRDFDGL